MEPIRAVRVLSRFNVGGPARQALALQDEMASLGVSTLLVGGMVQEGEADLASLLGCEDVVRISHLGRRLSPTDDSRALRSLYRLFRKHRPHVVHTHMAKAGALGRMAAALAGVPVRVHTFHGHVLSGYFGGPATQGVILSERILARISTALIAVSDQVRHDLLAHRVGRPDRFHVIRAGLDLEPYLSLSRSGSALRTRLGIAAGDHVVGLAGRLVPIKGIDVFLGAIEPIVATRPDVHVVIAGGGPDSALVRTALERTAQESRVHLLGWVADMAEFYGTVDLMVLSSRNEGTPLSLIEASAAGIPVVATRVGGVPEVVKEGETGLLVPAGSPEALQAAIERVLDDPILAARLGEAGRERARLFTTHRLATSLAALYRELLGETGLLGREFVERQTPA